MSEKIQDRLRKSWTFTEANAVKSQQERDDAADYIDTLTARVAELEGALNSFVDISDGSTMLTPGTKKCLERARAALKRGE